MGGICSFQGYVSQRGLVYLGFVGAPFTWSHGLTVGTRRAARLDRGICNDAWIRLFQRHKSNILFIHTAIIACFSSS